MSYLYYADNISRHRNSSCKNDIFFQTDLNILNASTLAFILSDVTYGIIKRLNTLNRKLCILFYKFLRKYIVINKLYAYSNL